MKYALLVNRASFETAVRQRVPRRISSRPDVKLGPFHQVWYLVTTEMFLWRITSDFWHMLQRNALIT